MELLLRELTKVFKGEITDDGHVLRAHSHDASIYEMHPEAVLFPRDSGDVQQLVAFVSGHKHTHPSLSITSRGAGTDMTGGAIGNSLVVNMTKHFKAIHSVTANELHVQPGVFMRSVGPLLDQKQVMIGSVPASRQWCTVGGMVANNAGGEQSLRYGNTENFVKKLKVVFGDGKEYTVEPLTRRELTAKMKQRDYEGELYRRLFTLIEENYDIIRNARPRVNKNSMGYNLWSVWDRDTGMFDLTRLITGSQGTLGIITDITFKLIPKAKHSGLLLLYLPNNKQLAGIIQTVLAHRPATFEGFDDITFELGIKYFSVFQKELGTKEWLKQQASLLSSVAKFKGHLPNLVLMVEFEGDTVTEVGEKIAKLQRELAGLKIKMEVAGNEEASSKFWQIRRASLSLLRERVHNKFASPFIDDLTVQPKYLPEFLPELRKIIRKYNLPATIAGHFGDGNFHIIPLMNIQSPAQQAKLEPTMREIIPLVLKYGGTLAGEHNDGMVRGPWLPAVFGDDVYQLFRQTKEIFDPQYIFNPHKKTDASWDFSMKHIRTTNKDEIIK
ncbi:MAG TPA: FAD-binding oxidoreductase [Candidatus Saccharimonadales bacterium]|nr:FAD-binding oxidoreductase [Candidatus Saccharimonadales bacterium]